MALVRASLMTDPALQGCRAVLLGLAVGQAHANFFDGYGPGPDRQIASVPAGTVHDVFVGGGEYKRLVFFKDGQELKLNAIDKDMWGKPLSRYLELVRRLRRLDQRPLARRPRLHPRRLRDRGLGSRSAASPSCRPRPTRSIRSTAAAIASTGSAGSPSATPPVRSKAWRRAA